MNKKAMRKTVILVGMAILLLLAACLIVAYFAFGGNLRQVHVPDYVITTHVGDRYEFKLDTERLIWEQHLPVPPASALKNYPEIEAVRSLGLYVTQDGDTYRFETVSTSDDPNLLRSLRRAGIVLKDTQWSWTVADIVGSSAKQPTDGFVLLSLPDYARVTAAADGSYRVTVDHAAMLDDCKFDLPLDPTQHSGYNAIMSLGIGCTPTEGGYRLQAQSGMTTIMETLTENRIRITDTAWIWTEAEMAERAGAKAPETAPEATATPEPMATAAPTQEPSNATSKTGAIRSLYGFDQTAVRVAIRKAKETYYGEKLESASILLNLFAVGNGNTAHANCFRVVYDITSTDGPEYLIADVYDLKDEAGYTEGDVQLHVVTSRNEARATTDLRDYTVYTLDGGSMVFPENAGKSPFDENGFVAAHSVTTALTYDELWDIPQTNELTLLQLLAFARNEMFARAGHQFPEGSYLKHFSEYDWYEPTGKVTTEELAARWPITVTNTSTIKFLEKLIKEG